MAISFSDSLIPANSGFPIVLSENVGGVFSVATKNDLYTIADKVLSPSEGEVDDWVGFQVLVRADKSIWHLNSWANRKQSSGWSSVDPRKVDLGFITDENGNGATSLQEALTFLSTKTESAGGIYIVATKSDLYSIPDNIIHRNTSGSDAWLTFRAFCLSDNKFYRINEKGAVGSENGWIEHIGEDIIVVDNRNKLTGINPVLMFQAVNDGRQRSAMRVYVWQEQLFYRVKKTNTSGSINTSDAWEAIEDTSSLRADIQTLSNKAHTTDNLVALTNSEIDSILTTAGIM